MAMQTSCDLLLYPVVSQPVFSIELLSGEVSIQSNANLRKSEDTGRDKEQYGHAGYDSIFLCFCTL